MTEPEVSWRGRACTDLPALTCSDAGCPVHELPNPRSRMRSAAARRKITRSHRRHPHRRRNHLEAIFRQAAKEAADHEEDSAMAEVGYCPLEKSAMALAHALCPELAGEQS